MSFGKTETVYVMEKETKRKRVVNMSAFNKDKHEVLKEKPKPAKKAAAEPAKKAANGAAEPAGNPGAE